MTLLRSTVEIDSTPDTVWSVVRETADVARWFPAMTSSKGDQYHRTVMLGDGTTLEENIVTCDDSVRRVQYRVVGGDLPITDHLGTIDVIGLSDGRGKRLLKVVVAGKSLQELPNARVIPGLAV